MNTHIQHILTNLFRTNIPLPLVASISFALLFTSLHIVTAQTHPNLIMTQAGVAEIRNHQGTVPLFNAELANVQQEVDAEITSGIDVPVPKDMAGGYTHERHKKNFFILQKAGALFQLTGDEKYAVYIRDMLLEYAALYPTLPIHPTNRSYATGKIFWQCLNDANWLVYTSQAYDCIYDWLTPKNRKTLEEDLFRPCADFLSIENPKFFNRIHNHSTWGNAAVGMIGLVMNDKELVERALYGLKDDGLSEDEKDNDDGFIKIKGQKTAGFLAQLDYSFSPDGYFTEGPYYLRYAIYPFLLFSKALANNRPDLEILSYRDEILKKAVYALFYQTDANGEFFPINDAQKGMSWLAREGVTAVDIAYYHCGKDPALLTIAQKQNKVLLDISGFSVAKSIQEGKAIPFPRRPIAFQDGADGSKGGVGILRAPASAIGELCLVMKYAAQGMGHGHFDKLSYSLYDGKGEVIQDYGAARWVNIDQKGGGRYLRENKTWAKQSIAHNTVVRNETSHYEGDISKGEANQPKQYFFSGEDQHIQAVSAKDIHAYPGTELHRTMFLFKDPAFRFPIVIDVFRIESETSGQYDLPTWFHGHHLAANFDFKTATTSLEPLGKSHGYQHLWKEASGKTNNKSASLTWFNEGSLFTQTTSVQPEDELIFARIGANDPEFNLRHDPAFIIRRKNTKSTVFASVIEPHGTYSTVSEIPTNPFSQIHSVDIVHQADDFTIISLKDKSKNEWTLMLSNQDASEESHHAVKTKSNSWKWQGPFSLTKKTQN